MVILIIVFAADYFQVIESRSWKPAKFVKEWEIKEINHVYRYHQILSITANKYGLFILVKATELKYIPPNITKTSSGMLNEEKKDFINQYVAEHIFSAKVA